MHKITSAVIVGAGNLATHLAPALHHAGVHIHQVYSRSFKKAQHLAKAVNAEAIDSLSAIKNTSDIYILAVVDSVIEEVANQLKGRIQENKLVVHCSGATSITALDSCKRGGIFYPLQTFSKDRSLDFRQIPVGVDALNETDKNTLFELAKLLTDKPQYWSDVQRQKLHLSAVFVNNFVNHILGIGAALTEEHAVDYRNLLPLVHETLAKAEKANPFEVQTGPAIRGDRTTIDRHLNDLANHPKWQDIYKLMTDSIMTTADQKIKK